MESGHLADWEESSVLPLLLSCLVYYSTLYCTVISSLVFSEIFYNVPEHEACEGGMQWEEVLCIVAGVQVHVLYTVVGGASRVTWMHAGLAVWLKEHPPTVPIPRSHLSSEDLVLMSGKIQWIERSSLVTFRTYFSRPKMSWRWHWRLGECI